MSSQAFNNAIGVYGRNRLMNPDSYIDQRNNGAATSTTGYTVDRYYVNQTTSGVGVLTAQQDTTTILGANQPTISSHKITVTTQQTTFSAGDDFNRHQTIEAANMRDSFWGTSNAIPFVYTVAVYVPVAGVYSISFRNSGNTRSYVTTITVVNANTLEFHSVVVPGDTGGTWATGNNGFVNVCFDLGAGTTFTTSTINTWQNGNFVKATGSLSFCTNTAGTTMHIAWEQFEPNYATDPEIVDYKEQLSRCQRYYNIVPVDFTTTNTGNYQFVYIKWPVTMRVAPTSTGFVNTDSTAGTTTALLTPTIYGANAIGISPTVAVGSRFQTTTLNSADF